MVRVTDFRRVGAPHPRGATVHHEASGVELRWWRVRASTLLHCEGKVPQSPRKDTASRRRLPGVVPTAVRRRLAILAWLVFQVGGQQRCPIQGLLGPPPWSALWIPTGTATAVATIPATTHGLVSQNLSRPVGGQVGPQY